MHLPHTPIHLSPMALFDMAAVPKIVQGRLVPGATYMSMETFDVSWRAMRWMTAHEGGHQLETAHPTIALSRSGKGLRPGYSRQTEEKKADKDATLYTQDKTAAFAALGRGLCTHETARLPFKERVAHLTNALRENAATTTAKSHHPSIRERAQLIAAQPLGKAALK